MDQPARSTWEEAQFNVVADLAGSKVILSVFFIPPPPPTLEAEQNNIASFTVGSAQSVSSSSVYAGLEVKHLPAAARGSVQLLLLNVPATIITIDLLRLLGGLLVGGSLIELLELQHPSDPHEYMVLLTFSTPQSALTFMKQFGGKHYTTLEPTRSEIAFVTKAILTNSNNRDKKSSNREGSSGNSRYFRPASTGHQTCPICLEALCSGTITSQLPHSNTNTIANNTSATASNAKNTSEGSADSGQTESTTTPSVAATVSASSLSGTPSSSSVGGGEVRLLCTHRFHVTCLAKCTGMTHCPVCRYAQSAPAPNMCDEAGCGAQEGLWMCLICGHLACGREQWTGATPTSPGFFSEIGRSSGGSGSIGNGHEATHRAGVGASAGANAGIDAAADDDPVPVLQYGSRGHALAHYNTTGHAFAQDPETHRVWDYCHDRYSTRLVLGDSGNSGNSSSAGGGSTGRGGGDAVSVAGSPHKVVEIGPTGELVPSTGLNGTKATGISAGAQAVDAFSEVEAGEALSLEFTHLLTTQLEAQRAVHENRLLVSQRECGSRVRAAEAEQHEALTTLTELQRESNAITKEFSDRQRKIARLAVLLEKVSTPSKDEAEMTGQLTINHVEWAAKAAAAEADAVQAVAKLDVEISKMEAEYQIMLEMLNEPD